MSLRAWPLALLSVATLSWSAAAQAPVATIALPLSVRGFVHRTVFFGCGQSWTEHVASTEVTLAVDAHRRAQLRVDAQIVEASGGVAVIEGLGQPHHVEERRSLGVVWTGRAHLAHASFVIDLDALVETAPVVGSSSGIVVTNRTSLAARLTCTRAAHDVLAASRPAALDREPVLSQRALVTCVFDPTEHEGPLPRPVRDALTPSFFLDEGAGVTTDASYRGYVTDAPEYLAAREPGWIDPP